MIPGYGPCLTCPLKDQPMVPPYGSENAQIMVVGEAPGATEVTKKRPFVGRSGDLLRKTLKAAGISPDEVYYTNAVLCYPPKDKAGNRTPKRPEMEACHQRLVDEIIKISPSKALIVGGIGAQSVLGFGTKISKVQGQGILIDLVGEDPPPWDPDEGAFVPCFVVPTYHPAAVLRNDDLFRDFAADIQKLSSQSRLYPEPQIERILIQNLGDLKEYLEELSYCTKISCDLETTGFSPVRDQILTIGLGALFQDTFDGLGILIPFEVVDNPEGKSLLKTFFQDFSGELGFHNLKFDLQFLYWWLGYFELQIPQDTMLLQYALDERGAGDSGSGRAYTTLSLKSLGRVRYDLEDFHFPFNKWLEDPPEERDWEPLYDYGVIDLWTTRMLMDDLVKDALKESPKLIRLVKDVLIPAALACTETELHGVLIDVPYLEQLRGSFTLEIDSLVETLVEFAKRYNREGLNLNSHVQIKALLRDAGVSLSSTAKEILQLELHNPHPAPAKEFMTGLIEYRQKTKFLDTYINGILGRVDPDGRVRPDTVIPGADSGRVAMRDPNLQNIPILSGTDIRQAIIAPPGWAFVEADYGQLELRVAAYYSQDPVMLQAFLDGLDIHREVAAWVFQKPPEEITFYERYMAKYIDFGIIYGRGPKSLVTGWEAEYMINELGGKRWTIKQAEQIIDRLLSGWPGLKKWIDNQHKLVAKTKFVESATGRRRRFPLIQGNSIYAIQRKAVNTPIQGLASDIDLMAYVRLHFFFKKTWDELGPIAYVLFPVHDSIAFEVRIDQLEWAIKTIYSQMVQTPFPDFNVPLQVEIKAGKRWGKTEEIPTEMLRGDIPWSFEYSAS